MPLTSSAAENWFTPPFPHQPDARNDLATALQTAAKNMIKTSNHIHQGHRKRDAQATFIQPPNAADTADTA